MNATTKWKPPLGELNKQMGNFDFAPQAELGGRAEKIITKVFGFTDDYGNPYEQKNAHWDIPLDVVQRNTTIPDEYRQYPWSIKTQKIRGQIGFATAISQLTGNSEKHGATNWGWDKGFVLCMINWDDVYCKRSSWGTRRKIVDFDYVLVREGQERKHWGCFDLPFLESINPCGALRDTPLTELRKIISDANTKTEGKKLIGIKSTSRDILKSNGEIRKHRNLQAYINWGNLMKLLTTLA